MSFFKKLLKKTEQPAPPTTPAPALPTAPASEPAPSKPRKRVVVIGLDGTPFSFVNKMLEEGHMPNLKRLIGNGDFRQMKSVYPTISSVAWTSFMTGVNPAKHGIFGFVDLRPGSYDMTIPLGSDRKVDTLWKLLSRKGKRVVVMNVPVTYPPEEVNGILVSGFLATNVSKATYPKEVAEYLKEIDYRTDTDARLARQSKDRMLEDIHHTFSKRVEAMFHFMENEDWDYFHTHIMCTDRLFHFLWKEMEENDEKYSKPFIDIIKTIDDMLGEVAKRIDENTNLIILSDHGFCTVKANVQLNYWLHEHGYLTYRNDTPKTVQDIATGTKAFSLIPGRVFIHTKDKYPGGSVVAGEYEALRDEIKEKLLGLRHPGTGERIIDKVFKKEEIYHGEYLDQAADLIAHPMDGYDIKGKVISGSLLTEDVINGMHTYHDAFLYVRGRTITRDGLEIMDVFPTILKMFEIEIPEYVDGKVLI